ncbi:MAG: oligoendopeptidase F [Tenericutes bacterium GWC2_34_14]|nr:MAG: oligoendopeptidase F [Tenericutes bacterium GWC2_34_14]OHE33203.1 MAG: oligoendopeptidase F [Tenericutes bacterium GWE2_34_108]OHE36323.1 MAG: oligoendopeptidase F [Tenericutes bacterium GWF1_35_14]OHE38793.1 MAG: oligoendopeptidase F [Tenericutes bacterium GWF2_35_184]OHE42629.1 MAG: oligoendopeptidase F [Tenericutes bacterium RIFOXYA12_FULL_35_10]OHE44866.1 MAG: oligoendopeptidase F [Tenericutes bacterium RIFOXYA2_FULL_36_32]OHE48586.1 MAG: oligoendopeptidase F [Tenericutes bacteriu
MTNLFKNETLYLEAFDLLEKDVDLFCMTYETKLNTAEIINDAITFFQDMQGSISRISAYGSLQSSTDSISEENQMRQGKAMIRFQTISKKMSFFINELKLIDDELLLKAASLNHDNSYFLKEIVEDKKYALIPEVEKTLVALSPVLNASYMNYNRFKLADMKFNDFTVDGKTYPDSFTLFENEYSHELNTQVRRTAHETFYQKLAEYQHGFASNYQAHVQKEKIMSELRGYSNVFDYLLYDQKVTKDFMDRQIDLIMEKLAPAMRRYANLLKEIHGLDKMTYADLKIPVDPTFEPHVTIDESKALLMEGLSVLGSEYNQIVRRSFDERWIDFPQNQGKSTGGFCSSPYGASSYILINWNGQMDEVMVLAHEIGHAGHFQYANSHQKSLNTRPSMYFIEAPSTTNELLMANHLIKKVKTNREKTWIKSVMISRTYYHNFVTHLLEAAFQREVYQRVDQKQPLSAHVLNNLKLGVLKKFWGDSVEIPDWAGLTWMRQPHYFMGLYPYTYSAGLTLGTKVSRLIEDQKIKPEEWIEVLKAGGTKTPLELAKMVGVDLTTDQTLIEVIEEVTSLIDDIIADKLVARSKL